MAVLRGNRLDLDVGGRVTVVGVRSAVRVRFWKRASRRSAVGRRVPRVDAPAGAVPTTNARSRHIPITKISIS